MPGQEGDLVKLPDPPDNISMMQDFQRRLGGLRNYIVDMGLVPLKSVSIQRLKQHVPEYADSVESMDDFAHIYRTAPYGKDMRRRVKIVTHKMWGTQVFYAMEITIMSKLNLEYVNILVETGKPCKTKRQAGCIK